MKAYEEYMDGLSVDETLHKKIMIRLEQKAVRRPMIRNRQKRELAAILCAAAVLLLVINIYSYRNIPNTAPNINSPNIPGITGDPKEKDKEIEGVTESGPVYHEIDPSWIVRQMISAKVPYGFFFSNKLIDLVKDNSHMVNNGAYWEEQEYTEDEIESDISLIAVKAPALPEGDYTVKRYVLIDETSENIIAYRTIYYYFDENTLEFQNSFSVFYFREEYFKRDELEQMKNVSISEGQISTNDFPEINDVHVKIPHVRRLVYSEGGTSIVIEAETDPVLKDNMVDEISSIEKYQKIDQQLITMMESLIK